MALSASENRDLPVRSRPNCASSEFSCTDVGCGAGLCFLVGSILFFFHHLQTAGAWLFLLGTVPSVVDPSPWPARELALVTIGDTEDLADSFDA